MNSVPAPLKLIVFALQHLLVMYASTVTVPVIVASALDLPTSDLVYLVTADLLLCGFGTLLQSIGIWKVGVRLPMVIGASYTGIAPMLIIGQGGGFCVAITCVDSVGRFGFVVHCLSEVVAVEQISMANDPPFSSRLC